MSLLNKLPYHSFRSLSNSRFFSAATRPLRATVSAKETKEAAEKVDDILLEPKKIKPTHGIVVCNLHFRSYIPQYLDFYVDFARRAAHALGIPCSGPVFLPTQISRWTVPRSPFIHKKSQENFERKTHKRLLQLKDANREVVERWLHYVKVNAPGGVGMRATMFEWEELGFGKRILEEMKQQQHQMQSGLEEIEMGASSEVQGGVKGLADKLVKQMIADEKEPLVEEKSKGAES
ncbi:mitochondrial 37S ribosomal protein uS10m [Calcarisporiella thermophila]|uniref:mitochondrial 37S ribosomal protein uS10m n=1 Tax=Calcarisporiella thermophila TaxID=911321 RepID=UPI0037429E26